MPEAHNFGMLPFSVIPAVRKGDPVDLDDCVAALLADGASKLFPGRKAEHRFTFRGEAEAAVERLTAALPASKDVWVVYQELTRSED